jgi:hypothetical protein
LRRRPPDAAGAGARDVRRCACRAASEPLDPDDVLRLTPEMQAYLDKNIEPMARKRGVRAAITEALYDRRKLQLEYDASTTRTAGEAFNAREGNCLSLVHHDRCLRQGPEHEGDVPAGGDRRHVEPFWRHVLHTAGT